MTEYARRARRMMKTYGRGGRTWIYWLTLPTPGRDFFRKTFPAVNAAIRRAGARSRRDVAVIDLVDVFTPAGAIATRCASVTGLFGCARATGCT